MLPHPVQASVTLRRGRLYKYKSLRDENFDHVMEIIKDHRIYCSRPLQLNDPAECKPQLVINSIDDPAYRPKVDAWVRRCVARRNPIPSEPEILVELASLTQSKLEALIAEATSMYQSEVDKRYRILSLADSLANHHLWFNYADAYAGVCVEFFVDPMLGSAYRVDYSETLPAIDITNNDGFDALIATALLKRTAWRNEREYRLVFGDPPIAGDPPLVNQKLVFPPLLMTGVIFGYRAPAQKRNTLLQGMRQYAPHARCAEARGGPPFSNLRIVPLGTRSG
jgi:hypothetical protein